MQTIIIDAPEIYNASTRPAIFGSIYQVLRFYNIYNPNTQIYYNGDNEVSKLLGSNNGERAGSDTRTDLKFRNKLYIVPEITTTEFNSGYSNSLRMQTHPAVWSDPATGILLCPNFEGRKISIDVNTHFNTRQDAQDFVNKLNIKRTQQTANFAFKTNIHWPLNYEFVDMVASVHKFINKYDQSEPDFFEWFNKRAKTPITLITNLAGDNPYLVFPKQIEEVQIIFEEPTIARAQKGDIVGRYEVSFRYYFYWQEHIGWVLTYPISIYNQLLEDKWLPNVTPEYDDDYAVNTFCELAFMNQAIPSRVKQLPYFIRYPRYDGWYPERVRWLSIQAQVLVQMIDPVPQQIFKFRDIPNLEWDPFYIAYIEKYQKKMLTLNRNPFYLTLYEDKNIVDERNLDIDEENNIIITSNPRMEKVYHVCLYVNYDVSSWSDECLDDIIKNPDEANRLLPDLFPWKKFPDMNGLDRGDIIDIIDDSQTDADHNKPHRKPNLIPNGMMYSCLIAFNELDYGKPFNFKVL